MIGLLEVSTSNRFYELSITKMEERPNTKIDPYYDIGAFVRYDIEDGHYVALCIKLVDDIPEKNSDLGWLVYQILLFACR